MCNQDRLLTNLLFRTVKLVSLILLTWARVPDNLLVHVVMMQGAEPIALKMYAIMAAAI